MPQKKLAARQIALMQAFEDYEVALVNLIAVELAKAAEERTANMEHLNGRIDELYAMLARTHELMVAWAAEHPADTWNKSQNSD